MKTFIAVNLGVYVHVIFFSLGDVFYLQLSKEFLHFSLSDYSRHYFLKPG